MKTTHIKKILIFLKYTSGSIGVGSVMADYKWVGVTCLVLGALSDAGLKVFFNVKD